MTSSAIRLPGNRVGSKILKGKLNALTQNRGATEGVGLLMFEQTSPTRYSKRPSAIIQDDRIRSRNRARPPSAFLGLCFGCSSRGSWKWYSLKFSSPGHVGHDGRPRPAHLSPTSLCSFGELNTSDLHAVDVKTPNCVPDTRHTSPPLPPPSAMSDDDKAGLRDEKQAKM